LLLQAGQAAAADGFIVKALAQRPAAEFQLTRAHALLALRRPADAAQCARLVLRARPNIAAAHQVLGHALADQGQAPAAIQAYRTAARLEPGLPDIQNNLGIALRLAGQLEEAEQVLRKAPSDPEALLNLSSVQKERADFAGAEATLRQALRLAPGNPVLLYNWSLLMLLLGRDQEARTGWEERFRSGAIPARDFRQPQWNGEPLGNRTLLVHTEQGMGDVIQFARFLPSIPGNVVFETPPRLVRLLSSNPAMPPPGAEGDLVVPLMSLPFRGLQPAPPPYLFAEPERVARWREHIGVDGYRIGIVWQGFSGRFEDKGRSLPLTAFRPLVRAGVRLISLQKGEGEEQIATAGLPLTTLPGMDEGGDAFVDTAAAMMSCDLIVTSDTSIAHLAGALGRPVWVALRRVPDWRWLLDRGDSPWYPSMRLFRQKTDGDWASVFTAMAEALPG
jgi:Tfp pilus assembly protein PilF